MKRLQGPSDRDLRRAHPTPDHARRHDRGQRHRCRDDRDRPCGSRPGRTAGRRARRRPGLTRGYVNAKLLATSASSHSVELTDRSVRTSPGRARPTKASPSTASSSTGTPTPLSAHKDSAASAGNPTGSSDPATGRPTCSSTATTAPPAQHGRKCTRSTTNRPAAAALRHPRRRRRHHRPRARPLRPAQKPLHRLEQDPPTTRTHRRRPQPRPNRRLADRDTTRQHPRLPLQPLEPRIDTAEFPTVSDVGRDRAASTASTSCAIGTPR